MTEDNSLKIVRQSEVGGVMRYQVYAKMAKYKVKLNI